MLRRKLIVIEVLEDSVVCSINGTETMQSLDSEGLVIDLQIGDEIIHIEHGFCDIYRNGEMVAGLSNFYTRLIK